MDMFSVILKIIGEPSEKLMKSMADEEKARIQKQREELGEDGLKDKEEELENASEENEVSYVLYILKIVLYDKRNQIVVDLTLRK